jgi:GTP cyclohydrolase IA
MPEKTYLTNAHISDLCEDLAGHIASVTSQPRIYGIPRGGVPVAYMLMSYLPEAALVEHPAEADVFVDDIVDSGSTRTHWQSLYPQTPFFPLINKLDLSCQRTGLDGWIVFPWEAKEEHSEDDSIVGTIRNRLVQRGVRYFANDNIAEHMLPGELDTLQAEVERRAQAFLDSLIIDTKHDHNTNGTAKRLAKMYLREVFGGRYTTKPRITTFPNAGHLDELYTTGPITVRSCCSHHLCPILGRAWVGVVPGERVIGLSKFNRLVEWLCSRPQIQEELVVQVADALEAEVKPKGLAVVIEASHTCMTWRGVKEHGNAVMTTSIMRGAMRDKPEARAEFLNLIKRS